MGNPKTQGRMLNKDISDSKKFGALSPEAAVLFCMLIPHYNSYGKINGGAGYIKDQVCPRVPYLTIENIPSLLKEIGEKTNVKWFDIDGRHWIHSVNFLSDHQNLNPKKLGRDLLPSYSEPTPKLVQTNSELSPELVPPEVEVEVEVEVQVEEEEIISTTPPTTAEDEKQGDSEEHPEPPVKNVVIPPCPHKKIITLYHETLPRLPKVEEWTDQRAKLLGARWSKDPARQNLEWWKGLFERVASSPFLMGDVNTFRASLDWIIRPNNFAKIIEGKYDEKKGPVASTKTKEKWEQAADGEI